MIEPIKVEKKINGTSVEISNEENVIPGIKIKIAAAKIDLFMF